MKLLIVDDHAGLRQMIRQLAEAPGVLVRECASAADALEVLEEYHPDCVTMDVRMEGMNGFEATRAVVSAQPGIRVVIVSAHDGPDLRRAACAAGAAGYVVKDNLVELKSWLEMPEFQAPERFRLLVENSLDVIVEATRAGEILYLTPNVRRVFGYQAEELVGTNLFANVHPDDVTTARMYFALPEGRVTCRYRHRDGSWRWIETSGREYLALPDQVRSVLSVRDVTERKHSELERLRLEAELYQNGKLSSLGLLAGGMAHDFNNMLTAVFCYLELARADNQQPSVERSLVQVYEGIQRTKNLARQILAFSRQQSEERQLVRLSSVVDEVVQLMRPSWPAALEVVTSTPPDTGWVLANPTQIHQVLVNLCTNAAHAMGPGPGRLEIRVDAVVISDGERVGASEPKAGRYVRLSVNDTGHGMDAATLRRMFEPFFTTKATGEGTGLGLAVVQRVIKDHGASIRVESEPGRGTHFQIYFPVHPGMS